MPLREGPADGFKGEAGKVCDLLPRQGQLEPAAILTQAVRCEADKVGEPVGGRFA